MPKPQVTAAVQFADGSYFGAAVYDRAVHQLSLVSECAAGQSQQTLLSAFIHQTMPETIVHANSTSLNIDSIELETGNVGRSPPELAPVRPDEFAYDPSRRRIIDAIEHVRLSHSLENECWHRSSADLDALFDNKVSVGAAGALLGYLSEHNDGQPAIAQIRIIRLKQYIPVGEDVLSTLGIVDRDQHPNMHALGRAKEGLSLFKLLDKTKSTGGRLLLMNWVLRPLQSVDVIEERLDAVEFLLQPKNTAKHEEMRSVLARMKSIRTVCARIHTELLVADLEALAQFAYATVKLHNIVLSLENVPDILGKFLDVDRACFNEIGSRIIRMVDFNNSKEEQRVVIASGNSDKVDRLRDKFDMLETILSQWSQQMSQAIGLPVAAVYYPQLGFLTSIEISLVSRAREADSFVGWELKFQTDEHQYFKNEFTEELDRTPGGVFSLIIDAEAEVGLELQQYICEHVQQIGEAYEMAAEIDCLQALATVARSSRYCRPKFASTQCIHIVGGRHPVLESTVADSSFIANSIHLCDPGCLHEEELEICRDDNPQTLVLVGPNASGKSVLLKQTALAVYMAHIGSFVPADFAIVSLTDRIFVMGKAMESLYRHTSALSADLELVRMALTGATHRSLVLLDEFGRGTNPADGLGLFCGVMVSLSSRSRDRPMLIAVTHFHEMRSISCIQDIGPLMRIKSMDYRDSSSGLVYLYKLTSEIHQSRYALVCASSVGIPSRVMKKAESYLVL